MTMDLHITAGLAAAAYSVVADDIEARHAGTDRPHSMTKLFNSLYVLSVDFDMPQHEVYEYVERVMDGVAA